MVNKEKRMIKNTLIWFCLTAGVAMGLMACGGEAASVQPATLTDETTVSVEAALADYEALRAAFAADKLQEVGALAAALETSANKAGSTAPAGVSQRLAEMATGAAAVKAEGPSDGRRKSFGEISRAVVALGVENPSLQVGRHVFQCPMAQGYKKWVQTDKKLENPYMGGRMLRCGSASEWGL
jgi:Cu(I)/Ag(I) efflux system membrane fusion protein